MVYFISFLFVLVFAPLVAHIRGSNPASLFFVVAAIYAMIGTLNFAYSDILLGHFTETEPEDHDTYYVVSHAHYLGSIGILMAVLGAITWAQTQVGAMRYPALTKGFFWVLHIALIGSTAYQRVLAFNLEKPHRYSNYAVFTETYGLISFLSGFLASAALLGLLCLLLWSFAAKWLVRRTCAQTRRIPTSFAVQAFA